MACIKSKKKKNQDDEKRKKQAIVLLQEMDVPDIKCGVCSCTPRFLQRCATKQGYLFVYCIVGLVIGMFFTYSVSTISTLEKRFKLSSKQTGIILAGNDVSQILLSIVVAYFGNYGNRPKWLGVGVLSASFSCFLAAIPHFLYGPGEDAINVAKSFQVYSNTSGDSTAPVTTNKNDLCYAPYMADCKVGGSDTDVDALGPVVILFFSEFFVGIGVTVFYSIGLVYLDDNVNKKDSPIYYAVSLIVRVCGPVLGYFLGSKCLALYIDPRFKPNISLRDPRWLGAWWLGFLILTGLLLVCGILILFFPRTLPSTLYKQIRRLEKMEKPELIPFNLDISYLTHYLNLAKEKQRFTKPSIARLPKALMRLFTNKIWVGNNFNTVLVLFALVGYWSFKPKYLEYQFRKSASSATFYTGVASLVASIVGLSLSGIVIKVFRPGPRVITGYSTVLTLISAGAMFSLMFIGCPKLDVIGGPNFNSSSLGTCNQDCSCTDRYSPVCSEDGLTTFYSPCYAGCTEIDSSAAPVEYLHCACVPSVVNNVSLSSGMDSTAIYKINSTTSRGGKTIQGYCPETCESFFYYIVLTTITRAIDSTGRIGGTLVYLRSVEERDKGLALGVSTVLMSLFSFIPAPIVIGAIVDSSCIIWDNTCGQKGNCWLYDSDKFRVLIHAVPAGIILLSVIGDIIAFIHSKNLKLYGEDEEKQNPSETDEMKPL